MAELLRTVAIDISQSVYENETIGIMYITKDIYSDSFIVAIPYEAFCYQVWENDVERELKDLLNLNSTLLGHVSKRELLINAIREGIKELE